MRININKKSQAWFTDFVIAILALSVLLIFYFIYTTNLSNEAVNDLNDLLLESKTVSSSLTSSGFPNNWNRNNVIRIGFTNNDNNIDNSKFNEFILINYTKTKKLLGTTFEYFLFFQNESNDPVNVEGFCGTGNTEVNITYNIKAAYYYRGTGGEEFLKSFMENEFNADVYREDGTPNVDDLNALINNINDYGFVVLEAPEFIPPDYNSFKAVAEPWIQAGGFFMLSGELVTAQKRDLAGALFEKDAGLSSSQEHATVVNEDEFLNFELAAGLIFDQGFTVENASITPPTVNFKDIARFNESELLFSEILDNKIAIARWDYDGGRVFFFSDFDTNYLAGNFQEILEGSTKKWIGAICSPINISNIKRDRLVKNERLLIYNNNTIKMVLYLWD